MGEYKTLKQKMQNPDDDQLLLYNEDFDQEYYKRMHNFRNYVTNFIKKNKLVKGAELGVRVGGLLFKLLDNCPDLTHIFAIDSWEDNKADDGFKFDHEAYELNVRNKAKNYGNRVTIIKGYTNRVHHLIHNDSLDFIFIDADHSYNNCKQDIVQWKPKVKKGGWLIGDDIERCLGVRKAVDELLPGWELASPNVWLKQNN